MANTRGGVRMSICMKQCLEFCRRHGRLWRDSLGRWRRPEEEEMYPHFHDVTVHALIVRGLLETCEREKVSRKPIGVKPAKEPV